MKIQYVDFRCKEVDEIEKYAFLYIKHLNKRKVKSSTLIFETYMKLINPSNFLRNMERELTHMQNSDFQFEYKNERRPPSFCKQFKYGMYYLYNLKAKICLDMKITLKDIDSVPIAPRIRIIKLMELFFNIPPFNKICNDRTILKFLNKCRTLIGRTK